MDNIKKVLNIIYDYLKKHTIMLAFVITSLINGLLLRYYTIGNLFSVRPFLTELSFLLIIAFIGHFIKQKNQFKYYIVWSILLTFICIINTVYYSNYISFSSISLLKTATELKGYTNAVFENILELKDFIYLFQIFVMCFIYVQYRKSEQYKIDIKEKKNKKVKYSKKIIITYIVFGLSIAIFFYSMLFINGIERLSKQWNRNSIVRDFGIYVYQANDLVSSVKTSVNSMFGYDEAYKEFRDYYDNRKNNNKENEYTNLFKGKNVIVIHGESLQGFTMNLKFNGKEVTPNLNKMAKEGIYFSDFYAEESVGNSSDSEFTSLTSILPSSSGTVFINYFKRDYETILKLLKKKDYYTFSMHANNGSAWNRNVMYNYLGYDDFYYYTKDYEMDEMIGLGLSDKSFFRQSVEKIKEINKEHKNFYGTLIMLTNHTPFSDTDNFDYSVDIKKDNEVIPWLEDTKVGNYLKSVNYADSAIGYLFELLEKNNLLDNTIVVLYGDHDAKLKKSELNKLFESEYYDSVLIDKNNRIDNLDDFTYEINRKVPFIIWSKDIKGTKYNKKVDKVMGMIDMAPTLANMLGVKFKYALGSDIFSVKDNVVVFPSGNWITDKIYYNSSKNEFRQLKLDTSVDINYINKYKDYAEKLIKISNGIITYDLIKAYETGEETLLK